MRVITKTRATKKAVNRSFLYEIFMLVLAFISVRFIWVNESYTWIVDLIVWLVFFLDFAFRFFKAKNKWHYIKHNPFDLIAIIPLDSVFRLARFARIFRIVRIFAMSSYFLKPVNDILRTNGLIKVIVGTIVIVFFSSIPLYYLEPTVKSYEDAMWWSFSIATTVGYGNFAPETLIGRIIALLLMLAGIGLSGMITGSIATYFLKGNKKAKNATVEIIKSQLSRWNELNETDLDSIITMLKQLKKEKAAAKDLRSGNASSKNNGV